MPNEKLEKLKHDQYVAEKKLTAAQHREKRLKAFRCCPAERSATGNVSADDAGILQ